MLDVIEKPSLARLAVEAQCGWVAAPLVAIGIVIWSVACGSPVGWANIGEIAVI